MKITVDFSAFRAAFHDMGRGDTFSREALRIIFDHLEECEENSGEERELDVIAICSDFVEWEKSDHADEDVREEEDEAKRNSDDWFIIGETDDSFVVLA